MSRFSLSHFSLHLAALAVTAPVAAQASAESARTILAAQSGPMKMDHGAAQHGGPMTKDGAHAMAGDVTIDGAYARASIGRAANSAAYMMLSTTADDRLVAAASPVADAVELHTHLMDNGVMKMRPVEGGIAVTTAEPTMLQPGGFHVMLLGLHAPLQDGTTIPLTLTFEKAGSVTFDVPVRSVMGNAGGNQHRHGG
jgi:copper(I)-binding protein